LIISFTIGVQAFGGLNPNGGHYTKEQKDFAIEKARSIGVRATSRLLHVPRRTIQT
jgi:hypothetical protein